MELEAFLIQTNEQVRAEINDRLSGPDQPYPFPESVFAEIVMQHMAEVGMTSDPEVCHYSAKAGNARILVSGFALSEDEEQLDLFVSIYGEAQTITAISDSDTKDAADQCLRFLERCAKGNLSKTMDESNDAFTLAVAIERSFPTLDQIRIYVLTDRQAKSKYFKAREVAGKTVKLEVMDIERLYRHWAEGKARDEVVVDFVELAGAPLPCVYVAATSTDYDYALTAIPGEVLRYVYEKYGARLLEANVRSFLSTTGKVNKGIRDTLKEAPQRFMAYNNGVVVVADEASFAANEGGSASLSWLKGLQIVNGGQTTASVYFTKKRDPDVDLRQVRVPAKIIILRTKDESAEEALIADVSRFANTQNSIRQSDLSANKPFHVRIEALSQTTYCPDGVGRWFYERAAGSYATMLAREGTTPVKLKRLRELVIPPSRKITKTDLAKYLNAWAQRPDLVSLGAQKNFERLMQDLTDTAAPLPDVAAFKQMVAKALLFKKAQSVVRPLFSAFQANITAYLVALVANRIGARINLDKIWLQQGLSGGLVQQLQVWSQEVNGVLHRSSQGRMISEWSKKAECWEAVRDGHYSAPINSIGELS